MLGLFRFLFQSDTGRAHERRASKKFIYLTTGSAVFATALLGIVLLFLAHTPSHEGWVTTIAGVLRDPGIALIVSTVIALLLEFYRYVHHRSGAMREMFDAVMSERITSDVWFELKELIDAKQVMRRNVLIRFGLTQSAELPQHLCELSVEIGYELHGLSKSPKRLPILHELDYQFGGLVTGLPRFTRFCVDDGAQSTDIQEEKSLSESVKSGRIKREITVPERGGQPVRVWLERRELVPVPGSYNFYTPEFMKGVTIVFSGLPAGIGAEVWVRPQGAGEALRQAGNMWLSDQLILPGQGIEVKFIQAAEAAKEDRADEKAEVKSAAAAV
jgi:hypothetical protein